MRCSKKQDWRSIVSILLSLVVASVLVLLWSWLAIASTATPSFKELVEGSDLIVVGTVTRIVPELAYYLPFIIYGAAISIVVTMLLRRRLKTVRRILAAGAGFFVLGTLLFYAAVGLAGVYPKVAVITVSQVVKGESSAKRAYVYYDYGHTCDATEFEKGKEYVTFLQLHNSKYMTTRFDWGVWEVTPQGVTTKRLEWDDIPPKSLPDFLERIRGIIEDPTNPEYAGIYKKERWGETTYYRIPNDPFFNPKARAKLDEREREADEESAEGDAQRSSVPTSARRRTWAAGNAGSALRRCPARACRASAPGQ